MKSVSRSGSKGAAVMATVAAAISNSKGPFTFSSVLVGDIRLVFLATLLSLFLLTPRVTAQDTVTGGFQGDVSDSQSTDSLSGAIVTITSVERGVVYNLTTDSQGRFYQGLLSPGFYLISVSLTGYKPVLLRREIKVSRTGDIVPVPVSLDPETPGIVTPPPALPDEPADVRVEINTADARHDGSYREQALTGLPLGGTTITRSFDELALLLPGVAPPPQTIGDVAGPGVGSGVGSAGQFAVNGLRSRANNFTVDGSDNNDEDIGVRRQGFVALVPQPIESIKEFQIQTLLAPAQFGRNIGAQVNAVSKGGGNKLNGSVYGFFNSSKLNARNQFDSIGSSDAVALRTAAGQPVLLDGQPLIGRNQSGGEDSFTFAQGGGTLGGAIVPGRLFYFVAGEYQKINSNREKSFAVPTIEERGPLGSGASGITANPFTNQSIPNGFFPSSFENSAVFSLFPLPNNPQGIFGANTLTQQLRSGGRGTILSGRLDHDFAVRDRQQTLTARYNFTDDEKAIPAVNEAIFATVRSKIRTHNLSLFLNSELGASPNGSGAFNQIRFSYGRSRLRFDEVRDSEFLIPSQFFPDTPFLLNAPVLFNVSRPQTPARLARTVPGVPAAITSETAIGAVGQVIVGGFSPLGVDVYNFPQDRTNQTLQLADELTWRLRRHSLVFGVDLRRTDLDSDLPRLSRPLITFNGAPRVDVRSPGTSCPNGGLVTGSQATVLCFRPQSDPTAIIRPIDVLGFGASSNSLLNFNVDRDNSVAHFRYYQTNFYAQDTWRPEAELSLSFGLRYEYNSPVKEVDGLVERTFSDPRLAAAPFIECIVNGRSRLYEPDYNNFAPRVGIAYSPDLFGGSRVSVFRAGYGLFYDQILGSVANQARNVFPNFITFNFATASPSTSNAQGLLITSPGRVAFPGGPILRDGTLNTLNPAFSGANFAAFVTNVITDPFPLTSNAIDITLPEQDLQMPMAHHFAFSFEQQLSREFTASLAYVGTRGRNLLRFTTPNLGAYQTVTPTQLVPVGNSGFVEYLGFVVPPRRPMDTRTSSGALVRSGVLNQFETTAESSYNAFQAQLRGRLLNSFDMQLSYTYSKVTDDVSDVFDLAGAYILPQNSLDLAAERAPANFDVRHRWAYNMVYSFGRNETNRSLGFLTDNLQIATTGRFHSGQPFTVNTVIDVNLDGNLSDRLNTTQGLAVTGDRRQPLRLTATNAGSLLAPFGQSGQIGRNSFRAGSMLELDVSFIKQFVFGARRIAIRTDIFNFINRANYGVPVRLLEAPGFGRATSTVTPGRRIQFSVKYKF